MASKIAIPTLAVFAPMAGAQSTPPAQVVLASGWQLQDAAKATQPGTEVAKEGFSTSGWYRATVPGTVLTTLVDNHVYPEPLYGENNRPEVIPDSLARTSWWYRTTIAIPKTYKGRHVWLNFDGINYSANVWVNGSQVGTIRGAFIRGVFDITPQVTPGETAVIAVLITPQPNPGVPHEHTLRAGLGANERREKQARLKWTDAFLSTLNWLGLDSSDLLPRGRPKRQRGGRKYFCRRRARWW